jgi:hypothetical protein
MRVAELDMHPLDAAAESGLPDAEDVEGGAGEQGAEDVVSAEVDAARGEQREPVPGPEVKAIRVVLDECQYVAMSLDDPFRLSG